MFQIIRELILKFVPPDGRTTGTISQRVARLDHELRNDTMENNPFEISASRMPNKVLHRFRSLLREESEMHVTNGSVDGGGIGNR